MSGAREARKVEKSRGEEEPEAPQREEGRKAMSRAREAQCRGEQAARRKVNSLNPFLVAVVKVPSGPQLHLLSILACENLFH